MILQMGEIVNFGYFFEEVKTKKMPFKVLYKLSVLSKAIAENTEFYREKLQEILHEYGQLDEEGNLKQTEDGKGVVLQTGREQECFKKMTELQNVEVELPDITFTIEEFDNVELTLEVFNFITPFIKE